MIRYYHNADAEEEFPLLCVQLFPVWRGDIAIINVINVDIDVRSWWVIVYIKYLLCRIRRCIVWENILETLWETLGFNCSCKQ